MGALNDFETPALNWDWKEISRPPEMDHCSSWDSADDFDQTRPMLVTVWSYLVCFPNEDLILFSIVLLGLGLGEGLLRRHRTLGAL